MAYSDKVIEHYENPRNVGTFRNEADVSKDDIGTGLVGAPACGDVMRLEIRVKDGLVIEHWANRDDLGTAGQLGWIPPTPGFLLRCHLATRRARRLARTAADSRAAR